MPENPLTIFQVFFPEADRPPRVVGETLVEAQTLPSLRLDAPGAREGDSLVLKPVS
jgi:hypothetical protein